MAPPLRLLLALSLFLASCSEWSAAQCSYFSLGVEDLPRVRCTIESKTATLTKDQRETDPFTSPR